MDHRACTPGAHCALFYRDARECVDGVARFVDPTQPVAVALPPPRARPLLDRLDAMGAQWELVDIECNPRRMIPAITELLARHEGRMLQYVEEPIWPGRAREEAHEATRHEALVNLAWPGAALRMLCVYDEPKLDAEVLAAAHATHPEVISRGRLEPSRSFPKPCHRLPGQRLEPAPEGAVRLCFGREQLPRLRGVVRERGQRCGLPPQRTDDLVLAVDELASNTIRHGCGRGRLRVWQEPDRIVCEVEDPGQIRDPLAGLRRPQEANGGVGLWAVNQLCDLVQLRSGDEGTVVRVHMALR